MVLAILFHYETTYHFTRSRIQLPSPLIRGRVVRHLLCLKDAVSYAIAQGHGVCYAHDANWKAVADTIDALIAETDVMEPVHFAL
jgi:hypothetical protein